MTGPQRAFPVWDGVPGYEFESPRASRRPPADHPGTGPQAARGPVAPEGEARRFRYTSTVSQPMPAPPSAWPRDEPTPWPRDAPAPWSRDEPALWSRDEPALWSRGEPAPWSSDQPTAPGFEFDGAPHGFDGAAGRFHAAGQRADRDRDRDRDRDPERDADPDRRGPRDARTEWARLLRSFLPEPVKRNWFAEFRSALHFRGAGVRVIIPILAMVMFGVAVAVIAGANSQNGPAPPPSALGFAPATLAGNAFSAAATGRGISQTLGRVTSDGAEIVAVGSQQGARIARAQFFVSTDDGRTWSMGHVRDPDGGPPPPGYAARFVAGGQGAWVAIGPASIWTSPDGRTWTLSSTVGLPLLPGDQISVVKRTAAGFIAAGSNVPGGNAAASSPVVFVSANGISWQRLGATQLRLGTSTAASTSRVLDIRYAAVYRNQILIAGDVSVIRNARTKTAAMTSAAWLSDNGGTTWTLAVPPGPAGISAPARHAAQAQISGLTVTADGFILLRPATVPSTVPSKGARKPAVDVYRSANGTTWTFEATLAEKAGFTTNMVNGSPDGAVVTGQSGPALIAFASADGASWRQTPAFGTAATQDVSGVAMAGGGTVVAAGTTTNDPDSRQPLLTVLAAPGAAPGAPQAAPQRVNIAKIPGAVDPELAVNDVAAGGGMQVAVGSANGYPAAWTSANGGVTWTQANGQTQAVLNRPGVQQLTSVTFGADGWLAVGGVIAVAAQHPVVLTSGNGSVWAAADREPAFSQPGLVTEQAAAAPGGAAPGAAAPTAGYVIVGYQVVAGRTIAAAWYSTGLTGWQRAGDAGSGRGGPGALDGPGASRQMRAVTAGPRGFVAVGTDGNAAAAWTSPNGQAWTQQNVPLPVGATRAVLQHVASNGHTVVAVGTALTTTGQQLPFAASSADGGITWTESALPIPQGRAFVTALASTGANTAAGSQFLATGTFGSTPGHQDVVVWTSATGSSWQAVTPAGQGLTGTGIQAITGLDVSDQTLTGIGFTATPGSEQPVFWQSPLR
jgi:hypothetical protein